MKFIHIAALALWTAGLFYLPALLLAHRHTRTRQEFLRVHKSGRFVYLQIVSPAACIAIAAGAALLFLTDSLHPWMFAKLGAVGALAYCHYRCGSLLAHLAEDKPDFPDIQIRIIAAAAPIAAAFALWLVLAKPSIGAGAFPDWLREPRGEWPAQSSSSSGSLRRMPI